MYDGATLAASRGGGKVTKTTSTTTSSIKVPQGHVDIVIDKLHPNIHTILFGSSISNSNNNLSSINDDCNNSNKRRACLVAHAKEALRILQAKRAHFGVKDKPLVRAALVIDYLCRNATNNQTANAAQSNECNYIRTAIPAATLATIAGFTLSKKDTQILEVMQTVLAEHLDDSSIGIQLLATKQRREAFRSTTSKQQDDNEDSQNCNTGRKRDNSSSSSSLLSSSRHSKSKTTTMSTNMNTTRTTSILKPTNFIQELCITFGPSIPDAEYAASYAVDIFHFLAYGNGGKNSSTTNDKNTSFTTYELRRDMERHTRYYEAACFYLAVKKSEGGNGSSYAASSLSKKKSNKKNNGSKKTMGKKIEEEEWNNNNNNSSSSGVMQRLQQEDEDRDADNDNNDERYLTESDVIRETNLLEGTFMTILACIQDRINDIVIPSSFDPTRSRGDDGSAGGSSTNSGGSTLFEVAGDSKTRNRNSSNNVIAALTTNKVDNLLDTAFEQWKRGVLLEAKTAYNNITMTNNVEQQQSANDDDTCWLTHAADMVLRNNNFQ